MTGRQLLNQLRNLTDAELEMDVIGVTSASGVSYEVWGPYKKKVNANDHAGVLVNMEVDTPYICLALD